MIRKLALIILAMSAVAYAATGTVTTTVMTPRFLAYSTATQTKLDAKLPTTRFQTFSTATQTKLNIKLNAADPVYTGTLTSGAADGTHYVQPYNSVEFSGTPSTGMIQTNSSGIQYYNGSTWVTPTTDISGKLDVTRFTRYSSAHIGGGTTDISGKLDSTIFNTYTTSRRATVSYVDAAISGVTAGSLPQSASDTGKADGASWINTTTQQLITRIGNTLYKVALNISETLYAILGWQTSTDDFGTVSATTNRSMVLNNTGEVATSSLTFSNLSSSVFRTYSTPTTIASNGNATIKYQFLNAVGSHTGHLWASSTGATPQMLTLTGTGSTSANPYTTYFASNWSGTGVQDISNPGGGVYIGWDSKSDTANRLSNSGNALVATYAGTKEDASIAKTVTGYNDISVTLDVTLSTVTMGAWANPRIIELRTGSTSVAYISITTAGTTLNRVTYQLMDGAGYGPAVSVSYAFAANTVYRFEFLMTKSSTTGTADGTYIINVTDMTSLIKTNIATLSATTTQPPVTIAKIGEVYSDNNLTGTITMDNFVMGYK